VADEIPAFDLYAELEVSERASVETIQAAYRSLQLRNHPDRAGADAGDRAVRLNVARAWLTDPARRARYDTRLAESRRATTAQDQWADDEEAGSEGVAAVDADDDRGRVRSTSPLHLARRNLRIDVRRLGRIWIVGLAVLGAIALVPEAVGPTWLRIGVAALAVLLLGGLALGLTRRGKAGIGALAVRWGGKLLGWAALVVLAVEGVRTVITLRTGGPVPGGIAEAALPALAVTALLSGFAVRRRLGVVETTVDEFLALTPRGFEAEVGRILRGHGYRLEVTGGPGDLAADLAGTDPDGRPTIVQCKRYAPGHPVGSRDVQLLIAMGVRHHGAEHLVLVTTSDFTDPARDLADEHGVELISGEDLEDLTR
jgi:hypothetical protein